MLKSSAYAVIFAVAGLAVLSGCRFKGVEGFRAATTPVDYKDGQGDPYTKGGIADATGGVVTGAQYGTGARKNPMGTLNPKLDQPAKGSGQEPGEQSQAASAGHGNSNAPSSQPLPGSANTR